MRPAEAFFREHFDAQFRANPTLATYVGAHDYDGELTSFAKGSLLADGRRLTATLCRAERLQQDPRLTAAERADVSFVASSIRAELLEVTELRPHLRFPQSYGSHLLRAAHGLIHRDFAPLAERAESLASRLLQAPRLFEEGKRNLTNVPALWCQLAIREAQGGISFLEEKVPQAMKGLPAAPARRLQDALAAALDSFRSFARHLETRLLPCARGDWRIGAGLYASKLAYEEMTAGELSDILAMGERELARLRKEFDETARIADPKASPAEVADRLGKDHPSAEGLLPETRLMLDTLKKFLSDRNVVTVPESPHPFVEESPAYMREWTFASMDTPGPFEKNAKEAFYYVTLPAPDWSRLEAEQHLTFFNRPSLWNTTVHEVYPGHYVQVLKNKDASSLPRQTLWAASFGEGWAHYCEQMMLDVGLGDERPEKERAMFKLAQLQDALLRACRYVAGIRMHCDRMTVEQATSLFVRGGYLAELPARREAIRGTLDPTYLVYTLGKMQILSLREECQKAWGASYSLKRFHDSMLSNGSAPVALHRRLLLPALV